MCVRVCLCVRVRTGVLNLFIDLWSPPIYYLPIHLSTYLPIYLSTYLPIYLSTGRLVQQRQR